MDEPKTNSFSETKKAKQLHSEISKFKTNYYYQSQPNFLSRKHLKQKPSKSQHYVVCTLRNLIYYLNGCYLIHILSYAQNI